jgi:glycosyltransferase involved in cell wall biosynthesis
MRISIVTAVYNGADSIAATLNSVAQQDYADIEHIVIDGASTDATLANIRSNSQRVSAVFSERDGGVYDAFNKGLRRATGDVIAFLNCGDTYASSYVVSKMADTLLRYGVQATFADVLIQSKKGPARIIRRYSSRYFSPRAMAYGLMPAHPTLFMRRETYESVGEYDTQFRIAGDFELCLRTFALRDTSFQYIPEAMVMMPSGGVSNRGLRSKWRITLEMRRACRLNDVSTNFGKLCLRFPLKIAELM